MTLNAARRRQLAILIGALAAALQPQIAAAYIDPNTGGLIFQLLAPIFAMIASAWLLARDYIRGLWYRVRGRTPPKASAPGSSTAAPKSNTQA